MNFIYQILETIISDTWYGVSNEMEIAKGKNKLKTNVKERLEHAKRRYYFHKNK